MRTRALILEGPSAGLIWLKKKQSVGHLFLQLQGYYLLFDLLFLLYTLDMQARNPLDLFPLPKSPFCSLTTPRAKQLYNKDGREGSKEMRDQPIGDVFQHTTKSFGSV